MVHNQGKTLGYKLKSSKQTKTKKYYQLPLQLYGQDGTREKLFTVVTMVQKKKKKKMQSVPVLKKSKDNSCTGTKNSESIPKDINIQTDLQKW